MARLHNGIGSSELFNLGALSNDRYDRLYRALHGKTHGMDIRSDKETLSQIRQGRSLGDMGMRMHGAALYFGNESNAGYTKGVHIPPYGIEVPAFLAECRTRMYNVLGAQLDSQLFGQVLTEVGVLAVGVTLWADSEWQHQATGILVASRLYENTPPLEAMTTYEYATGVAAAHFADYVTRDLRGTQFE